MSTLLESVPKLHPRQPETAVRPALRLQCPACCEPMEEEQACEGPPSFRCTGCEFVLPCQKGIWNALAPQRAERFRRFIEEYQTVRLREGRGSGGGSYYLALPFKDLTGRNRWQWRIRSRSFRYFTRHVLPRLERQSTRGLDILDLGAGNCWLSYRLASRGHRPVAVDLLVNDLDGLGAARHYFHFLPREFPRFQAEMDRLPFAGRQFDLVVFNASFHYSEDYERTLSETLRCLRRPGHAVIMDSPIYDREESGRKMVQERREQFKQKYGFASDSIASREYLTTGILEEMARGNGLVWREFKPWYGAGWALRPLRARLTGRREPAKFHIFWGTAI